MSLIAPFAQVARSTNRSTPTMAITGGRSQNVIADRARPQISRQRGPARTRLRFQLTPRPRCGDPQAKTHPRPIGAAPTGQQAFPIRPSKGPEPLKGKRHTAVPFQEVTVHRKCRLSRRTGRTAGLSDGRLQ
jgi:hypothetical protein